MTQLATLSQVKEYGGITSASFDSLLTSLIAAVSASIEQYCSRSFSAQSYTDVSAGSGTASMPVANTPIISVSSLTIDGQLIKPEAYRWTKYTVNLIDGGRFPMWLGTVTIAYTAGYASIPADITTACCEAVVGKFKQRDRIGIKSKGLAGEVISYDMSEFSESVMGIINRYKSIVQA